MVMGFIRPFDTGLRWPIGVLSMAIYGGKPSLGRKPRLPSAPSMRLAIYYTTITMLVTVINPPYRREGYLRG